MSPSEQLAKRAVPPVVDVNADGAVIRDLADRLRSFWKQELSEFRKEPGKSPMPSYRNKLSPAELDDLVAYLASLRGES